MKSNIHYVDEGTIVYPCGHNSVLYNTETREQAFIHGADSSEGITALAVTPSKRYLAVAEKSERPQVSMYDLTTMRRRKVRCLAFLLCWFCATGARASCVVCLVSSSVVS